MSEADEIARNEIRAVLRQVSFKFYCKKDSRWASPARKAAFARVEKLIKGEIRRMDEAEQKDRP